jgi:hypothetical protein
MRKFILAGFLSLAFASQAFAFQYTATYSSGNVANATATATVPAAAQTYGYLTGFEIIAGGATAGVCVNATITGLLGGVSTYPICAPTGPTLPASSIFIEVVPPLRSSTFNTAIVLTLPALGAGNTNAAVVVHGYSE